MIGAEMQSGRSWRFGLLPIVAAGLVLVMTGWAQGQVAAGQRQRVLEEPFRLQMGEGVPIGKRAPFDYGGWFRSSVWMIDEDVDRPGDRTNDGYHAARWQQLRMWGALTVDEAHEFYARGMLDYWDWNHHTSYDRRDHDLEGMNLERGWYAFRMSRLLAAKGEEAGPFDWGVQVGRQYVEFGTGLSLSIPLDAILLSGYYGDWQVTGLGARSVPSTYNIDRSVPDDTKEDRRYWGVEVRYHGCPDHQPFAYYWSQEDHDAGVQRLGYTFGYDSEYIGAGSRGRLFHRDLQYTVEAVGELGKSYADAEDVGNRQNIHAWAFDTEVRWFLRDRYRSQVAVEYMLASGDSDRDLSPTNTMGGNRLHTADMSFNGWGYRDTGIVLAPRITNLGMVKVQASAYPWREVRALEHFKVSTNLYVFHKNQAEGAMSDQLSVKDSSYVGSEMDLCVNWRIMSDLAWMLRYGVFLPGDAFSVQKDRQLLFTGVTINF